MNRAANRRFEAILALLDRRRDSDGSVEGRLNVRFDSLDHDLAVLKEDLQALKGIEREHWIEDMLEEYSKVVRDSSLTNTTKATYIRGARQFVRSLRDDYEPGTNRTTKN